MNITDLMRESVSCNHEVLKAMLEHVEINDLIQVDKKGRTALDWARIKNDKVAVGLLTEAMTKAFSKARINSLGVVESVDTITTRRNIELTTNLVSALDARDAVRCLKVLVESYLSRVLVAELKGNVIYFADVETTQGDTAVMRACGYNMVNVVHELISLGVDINKPNQYGHTPFTWACLCGHAEIVKILVAASANIKHKSQEGKTGLHYACLYGKTRVVAVIVDYLCDGFASFRPATFPYAKNDLGRWTKYIQYIEGIVYVSIHYYITIHCSYLSNLWYTALVVC
jgi:ankyrin repeat protein